MDLELVASFLIGLLGSLHCLGMCGPLVLAYSLNLKKGPPAPGGWKSSGWGRGILHHLAFQSGRIMTYGLLGALAAGLMTITDFSYYWDIRGTLLLGGGTLMTLLGLVLLKVFHLPLFLIRYWTPWPSRGGRFLVSLFERPGSFSKMGIGASCGLLPCALTSSLLVKAAVTENMVDGAMTMLAFGLGTVPALLTVGISASWLSQKIRIIGERLAALSVMAMGLFLLFKGARILLFPLGHPCH